MNIGIIGVGKLGIAFGLAFEKSGLNVFASSYKSDYVKNLNNKQIDSIEPGVKNALLSSTNIKFTVDNHNIISNCDVIYVMVATPSLPSGDYDVSAVWEVTNDMLQHAGEVRDKILIIGCTTNPGVCDEIQKILHDRGVHVVYCPTFSAQGSVMRDIADPHALLLGTDNKEIAEICKNVFFNIIKNDTPVFRMSPTSAEIIKLAGNCKSTAMISYHNMIGQILIESGLEHDVTTAMLSLNSVKDLVSWKFGFGFGGPCYPRDNRSMIHYAHKLGIDYKLGQLVDDFNNGHADYLTNYFIKKNVDQLPFYFDYVSYKKGVNMYEESQQLVVCKKLLGMKNKVYINPSDFLLPKIIKDLTDKFSSNVEFLSMDQLIKSNIKFFKINC